MTIGIVLLFLASRIALLLVRQPFFDELFTRWIAGRPFDGMMLALQHDSGPPLYYFIVHALGNPPLLMLRALSLAFATIALIALLQARQFTAAALLAVFPPAVLFAVDARAYALCAMFVTLGVLALERDRPYAAALAFVAAAYSHYYGALFITVLPVAGYRFPPPSGNRQLATGNYWRAFLLAVVLFSPGVWLAMHQPRGSMAWIGAIPAYPEALLVRPPFWLIVIAAILLVIAAAPPNRFAAMTLIPLALALALRIYFPLRFESVIAAPLVLWLALSARRVVIPLLIALGLAICAIGILDHFQRPIDDYRAAVLRLRQIAAPTDSIVASGYLYLEAVSAMGERVRPFPAEQGEHPGWRAAAPAGSAPPAGAFLWIGERAAPELAVIRRSRAITPLYVNGRAAIVKVN
jgi:hypothetical protein